jgi:hypothetical protein
MARSTRWTAVEIETIKARYLEDGPTTLAKELGRNYWSVVKQASRLGLITRKAPLEWTESMTEALLKRYEQDGAVKLADELGVALRTVHRRAAELGLRTNGGHRDWGRRRAEACVSCDTSFFDAWSPDMAYVLGFLFADGTVSTKGTAIAVNIASRDESVLEFIKTKLNSKHKIGRREGRLDKRTGMTNRPQSGLVLSSTKLVEGAKRRGLLPRKTYNDDPFPDVPDNMLSHFTRGYLDGDGCVSVSAKDVCHISFVGSPRFIEGLRDRLVKLLGVKTPAVGSQGRDTKWAVIKWYGIEDLFKFKEFLYPSTDIFCLARKRDKLIEWLAKPRLGRGAFFGNRYTGPLTKPLSDRSEHL